ncbi:heavy-metal-associated domain-containing protein [bacterium]|nr:heavy-metal-associated domain-containing protein [bacterium]
MKKLILATLVLLMFSGLSFASEQESQKSDHSHGKHKAHMEGGHEKAHEPKGKGHGHGKSHDGHGKEHGKESHKAELGQIQSGNQEIKVKGMVCEVCAYGIRKTLKKEAVVKSVEVNIKDHLVRIEYKDPKKVLSNERLAEILVDAGYELDHGGK